MRSGGWFIELQHDNGYYTNYLHMLNTQGNNNYYQNGQPSSAKYVKVGDYVTAGTRIGDMGSSGTSSGTHLHFGIWRGKPYAGGTSYNPLSFY